jgi:hypothetical protein
MLSVESVRSFFDVPRTLDVTTEGDWYREAPGAFLESDPQFSADLSEGVANLLTDYPNERIARLLLAVQSGDYNQQTVTELRFMRKVIMIGRDTLRLTTTTLEEEDPLRSMGRFAGKLGALIDDIERHGAHKVAKLSFAASRAIDQLGRANVSQAGALETNEAIEMRVRSALTAQDLLTSYGDPSAFIDESRYHHARRLFRSVVHLGVASTLLYPSHEKAAYVRTGIELSGQYGDNHDAMIGRLPK